MSNDPRDIGQVIAISGDQIEVAVRRADLSLHYEGKSHLIGKVGTYVTLPRDERTLIAYVIASRLLEQPTAANTEKHSSAPRDIILQCQLIGTIVNGRFSRGVNDYPIPGDLVRIAVDSDFATIFGSPVNAATAGAKSFPMGRFAVNTNFQVRAVGKEFFSRHVAVMGNSGSGKSVTTTKIIHEALQLPHSQVVLFDMHGEYLAAFSDEYGNPLPNVTYLSDRNLVLPYWLLAYEEFERLFVDLSNAQDSNAQRLFLRMAFEKLKQGAATELGLHGEVTIDTPVYYSLEQLLTYATNMNSARFVTNTPNYAFSRLGFRQLSPERQEQLLLSQKMEFNSAGAEGETPHATYFGRLLGLINLIETRLNDRRFDFLMRPFDQTRLNLDLAPLWAGVGSPADNSRMVGCVIRQLLGQMSPRKNLTIVDLSGLPFEVVDITVSVLTRTLFDFNFWSPVNVRQPVLMVYEEAHNYLPRRDKERRRSFARDAVEKVAKEGRKYGVSAMIVSQRPSEISETVLSQCNSMVLMRLNNPDDQEYAARVVSDQFRSLISLLPSLRPGEGFIIGDSVLMPMRTLIDLPPRQPQSASLDYFELWGAGRDLADADGIIDRWWRQERSTKLPSVRGADPRRGNEPANVNDANAPDGHGAGPNGSPELRGYSPHGRNHDPASDAGRNGDEHAEPNEAEARSAADRKLAELAAKLGKPGNE